MKRFPLSLLITLICSAVFAQQKLSFSVLEFEQDVFDTSAKSTEHGKKDGNGSWYAIIKVTSNNPDDDITACQFNFGNMSSKVEKHDEALWVYVQRNAKKVTISRPGYHTINQYDLQTTIEAGANYKMVLTSDRVLQQVLYDVQMQMVKFQTSPAVQGAMVLVTNQSTNEKISVGVTASNGAISKALKYGTYSYEVLTSDNLYHPSEGIITLSNSKEVLTENVVLRPNFAEITLQVGNGADIYIDNEFKGKSQWKDKLAPGSYIVTCKKEKHRESQYKLIVEQGKAQVLTLPKPIPLTGTLVINTTPTDAIIMIDDKELGKSPQIIKDLLIGKHTINLSHNGYLTNKEEVVIEEGNVSKIDITLDKDETRNLTFSVDGITFSMIYVEGGTFERGAKDCHESRSSRQQPVHQVSLTKDYYIGETEVTQALWKAVMGYSPIKVEKKFNNMYNVWTKQYGMGDDYPAYYMNYEHVQTFIKKLNKMTGQKFRLPTDAEWEYAARGGKKSKGYTYCGSDDINEVAWYRDNADLLSKRGTRPVKTKAPNELGIYDMSGNVSEWCSGIFEHYTNVRVVNPQGPEDDGSKNSWHVVRGGSWTEKKEDNTAAFRWNELPTTRDSEIGFRLAL